MTTLSYTTSSQFAGYYMIIFIELKNGEYTNNGRSDCIV